jgi:hypothetical protein
MNIRRVVTTSALAAALFASAMTPALAQGRQRLQNRADVLNEQKARAQQARAENLRLRQEQAEKLRLQNKLRELDARSAGANKPAATNSANGFYQSNAAKPSNPTAAKSPIKTANYPLPDKGNYRQGVRYDNRVIQQNLARAEKNRALVQNTGDAAVRNRQNIAAGRNVAQSARAAQNGRQAANAVRSARTARQVAQGARIARLGLTATRAAMIGTGFGLAAGLALEVGLAIYEQETNDPGKTMRDINKAGKDIDSFLGGVFGGKK